MDITFSTDKVLLGAIPDPVKANKTLPEYFKKIPPQTTSDPMTGTVKRCLPFLEASSAGYIIPLWADMFVRANDDELNLNFPPNFPMSETMSSHSIEQIPDHPYADKPYGTTPLKLHNPWVIETEEGVSCLITAPLNHLETRFKLLDGIVDTDNYYNNINFPFLWTGGKGEFFIPKGTPIAHIIPFRRGPSKLSITEVDNDRRTIYHSKLSTCMRNSYKTQFSSKRKKSNQAECLENKIGE